MITPDPPFLDKAREALRAANLLCDQRCSSSAVNRAYFAMFHAARCALVHSGRLSSASKVSHDKVQSDFALFLKQRTTYPSHIRSYLTDLMDLRHVADYETGMISSKVARRALDKAREFVDLIEKFVRP